MKKFTLAIILITVFIVAGGVFLISRNSSPKGYPLPTSLEYYWGNGCPHCQNVEDFMSSWNKKDAVKIEKMEVWGNRTNVARMQARYEYCRIPSTEMGVPLLFTPEGKCYSGDIPIINYLKSLSPFMKIEVSLKMS
jgi:hypothetical protein